MSIKIRRKSARKPSDIQPRLDQSLKAYVLAAGAAGVSLLAQAQSAEAKIVFTPTNQSLTGNGSLKIDLNADGVNDFTLVDFFHTSFAGIRNTGGPFPSAGYVGLIGSGASNQVVVASNGRGSKYEQALNKGAVVGSNAQLGSAPFMAYCSGTGGIVLGNRGPWAHATSKYLGLKFVVNGQTHFGWARLTVRLAGTDIGCQYKAVLTGYAYETVPNKSITAGDTNGPVEGASEVDATPEAKRPESLGMLALGAPGLTIWRKED